MRVRVIITGIATTEALNSLEVSNEHGAPFTGYPCDVTHDQTTELLSSLLTRTGTVHMPCPGAPNGASLLVPRRRATHTPIVWSAHLPNTAPCGVHTFLK